MSGGIGHAEVKARLLFGADDRSRCGRAQTPPPALDLQGDDNLVFAHPQTGGVLDHSKLERRYKKAVKAAKIRDVRFNDLRHTFGTRMAAAGVPLRTLQEWLGHRDFKTTLIYADYAPVAHEAEMAERAFARRPRTRAAAPPIPDTRTPAELGAIDETHG
jgi:integrase